uniref:Glycosyltransferase family 2 protein n=2 Tax=Niallia circulans TaxID=1397 RepID=A0A941JIJ3_NIACI|nr:glycosyltransferase family 2 protein [Niallia circulans]
MIVKNEEEVLYQCLESVKALCDEIIIVDTGSTDKTKNIANQYTDKVYDFIWIDDFSAARNFAFEKATKDFIFWLDADDILLEADQQKLHLLKNSLDQTTDAVSMFYHIAFDANNNPTFLYRRNRLVKRERNFRWIGPVHEYLEVYGEIHYSDIAITHCKTDKKGISDSSRNLRIYENRLKNGDVFSPRDLFYYSNELREHGFYEKAIQYYEKFLSTKKGWVEDEIRSCINMSYCYKSLLNSDEELYCLLRTFSYDLPRQEVLCLIGDYFQEKQHWSKSIFWYTLATNIQQDKSMGFFQPKYSSWYPHLQLCICYWNQGEIEQSFLHHQLAKEADPNNKWIKLNEKFFHNTP